MKQPWSHRSGAELTGEWRFAALAGVTAGLALAPAAFPQPSMAAIGAVPPAVIVLVSLRPAGPRSTASGLAWLGLIVLITLLLGLLAGGARVSAIDGGALRAKSATEAQVTGFVAGVPRRNGEEVSVRVDSPAGRVLVVAREPVGELPVGIAISAAGVVAPPEPWRAPQLRRQGIAMTLRADRIELGPGGRGGLAGWIDGIRGRAEQALERGMPERESSLARGFVLGEDDLIDARTREEFRRSSLAHLLAVSGQNVILLCLLAWPLLAVAGLTFRARLIAALCLIAIYVPVTGAGPSIQRAGVMGAAGLVAALADRPRSRWYAVLLAAAVTLAINPRAAGDIGWQLSFAAVIGILLWSRRLVALIAGGGGRGAARRALAEGVAVTVAATLATAPLMAHHFEQLSPAALPANILALPAVAPAMWLGMLAGIAGQVPLIPVEPLNWLNSLCLAYIAQIAHWLSGPDWALLTLALPSVWSVAAAYAGLLAAMGLLLHWLERRREFALPALARVLAAAAVAAVVLLGLALGLHGSGSPRSAPSGLVVRVLDVGQGDSILFDPVGGQPVLVDTGPAGGGVGDRLSELGIGSLAAVVITHDQSDHAGGLGDLLEAVAVDRVVYGLGSARLRGVALAGGAEPFRLAEGGELVLEGLRITALWPPPELLSGAGRDPNQLSLVLIARWRHFSILLTGDAEAESVPIEPGPVDVLKVAHHGSEDAGLGELLEGAVPKLAVISVGEGNPYGHPAAETIHDLRSRPVATMRTDEDGEIAIEIDGSGWTAGPDRG